MRTVLRGLLLGIALGSSIAQAADVQTDWEVVNRFPLFTEDVHFARIAGIRIPSNPDGTRAWHTSDSAAATVDSPNFTQGLRHIFPTYKETAWDPKKGGYNEPKLMRTSNSIVGKSSQLGEDCQWELLDVLERSSLIRSGVSCSYSPPLAVDITKKYKLSLLNSTGELISPQMDVSIESRLIIAMGDSFASGEGNPDHPAILESTAKGVVGAQWMLARPFEAGLRLKDNDWNNQAQWLDPICHRSLMSWPALKALKRAVTNTKEVVRFASFACSGAEVYDGILSPQTNPPGSDYHRDHLGPKPEGSLAALKYSQIEALSFLICKERGTQMVGKNIGKLIQGKKILDLKQINTCKIIRHKVDDLLLMIGGNDAFFSRVVSGVIHPMRLETNIKVFSPIVNYLARSQFAALSPKEAAEAFGYFPDLYKYTRAALSGLGISEERTQLAIYPHVLEGEEEKSPAFLQACVARTKDGFMPLQLLTEGISRSKGAAFGIKPEILVSLRDQYIDPMRKAQIANRGKWGLIDTNIAFSGKRFCSTEVCQGDECSNGDRVRWQWRAEDSSNNPWAPDACRKASSKQEVHNCDLVPLRDPASFNAYDSTRKRGMRYATDAFLAMAGAYKDTGRSPIVRMDAINGIAHPTGNVHARIADLVVLSGERAPSDMASTSSLKD